MTQSSFTSLRWKLLLLLGGLVLVILAAVLLGVSYLVQHRTVADINQDFAENGRIFERIQQIRFRQLRQTAILVADAPGLKAAVSTGDPNTVDQKIEAELLPLLDFDPLVPDSLLPASYYTVPDSAGLLLVCDTRGYPVGQLGSAPRSAYAVAERPGVAESLQGIYPSQPYIWEQGGRYFNVTTVPIWLGPTVLGTLSYGHPIRRIEALQLARDLESEVTFFVDNRIVATSFDALDPADAERLAHGIYDAAYRLVRGGAATFEVRLRGEQWLVYVTPILPGASQAQVLPGFYAVARSYTQAAAPLRRLQRFILVLGLGAVLVAVVTSFALTNRITRPIDELVEGIEQLERGNYEHVVPVVSNDELGRLTGTFNTLVAHLRERLQMLKFVSGATLEAIKKNLDSVQLGGERREATLFFSDIRGFTSWSERRRPEEVVEMLNRYLRIQAEIVHQHRGDVDKFVGDELVAVFTGEQRDRDAVAAAVAIQKALADLGAAPSAGISVGIGINSGLVVMGAVGSAARMDYTVIGSHVNLAARLCTAAAPGQILIAEQVAAGIERRIPIRALEPVRVKGIEEPVQVFEVEWRAPDAASRTAPRGSNMTKVV